MHTLQNPHLALELDPEFGIFNILPKDQSLPSLTGARLGFNGSIDGTSTSALVRGWRGCTLTNEKVELPEHGWMDTARIQLTPEEHGLAFTLHFGILQEYPLVMWRVEVENTIGSAVEVESIDLLHLDPNQGGKITWPQAANQKELGFYSNGWQSWSSSRWYAADQAMVTSRLGGLQLPMTKNPGTPLPRQKGVFSSDFFAVLGDRTARSGFLVGSLSQFNHFTSIVADFNTGSVRMYANGDRTLLNPGCSMQTDWAVFNPVLLDHRDPLEKYLEAVARQNHIKIPAESLAGWCSWYHFYTQISEPIIQQNLKAITDQQETLPLQLVQIDDGFESQIGDWFSFKPEFPNGVAPLAAEIRKQGLLPGLWLAPFILHPGAEVVKQHPEWLLRKANGKHVNCGFVWNSLTTALDLTVPEALEYACSVVRTASAEWGYPYLKLDFLYAAVVECQYHDSTLTRAQVLRRGMEAIRAAVGPEVTLLGCGAPLGSMLGLVEAMRIGADVSGDWLPKFNGIGAFIKNEPAFPCARNSIQNILTRAFQHQHWWINDPDCLLIRPDTHLSLGEVQTLASAIALTGGSLLVSDDLPKLPAQRLRIAECLLPVIGERARVVDWFDGNMPALLRLDQVNETGEWHILAKFNWQDQSADLALSAEEYHLPSGEYWVSDFWGGECKRVGNNDAFEIKQVPAHGCVVTAWRRHNDDQAIYLGSDLHISQGLEVAEWQTDGNKVSFTLRLPRKAKGEIRMVLPTKAQEIRVNDGLVSGNTSADRIVTTPVELDGFAHVEVMF